MHAVTWLHDGYSTAQSVCIQVKTMVRELVTSTVCIQAKQAGMACMCVGLAVILLVCSLAPGISTGCSRTTE